MLVAITLYMLCANILLKRPSFKACEVAEAGMQHNRTDIENMVHLRRGGLKSD